MQSLGKTNHPELLAPAGSFDALKAAVHNGADAVYLGLTVYGARAKAQNFSLEEIKVAADFVAPFAVKLYLTANTLLKPKEYDGAIASLRNAVDCGISAVIVQDLLFLDALKNAMPDLTVHLSTQAGIHNVYGAIVAERLGASRVILSRETLLDDIKEIKARTNIEIEAFVHGATCVAFSGNCYFSSLAAGLSGNRGRCLQLCRKQYEINGKKGYFLSPKDIALFDRMDALIEAGVTSFKIEGRMRRPEYVGAACRFYREVLEGKRPDMRLIKRTFCRGKGYHRASIDEATPNPIFTGTPGHMGEFVGTITDVKNGVATVLPRACFNRGDGFKLIRGEEMTGGAVVKEDGAASVSVFGAPLPGDELYITTDAKLNAEISQTRRALPISVAVSFRTGTAVFVKIIDENGNAFSFDTGIVPETAKKSPLNNSEIATCFRKTDDAPILINTVDIQMEEALFLPKSQLNECRRAAYRAYLVFLSKRNRIEKNETPFAVDKESAHLRTSYQSLLHDACKESLTGTRMVAVDDLSMLGGLEGYYDYVVYAPDDYGSEKTAKAIRSFDNKANLFLYIPSILRGKDIAVVRSLTESSAIKNVVINNVGQLELFKDLQCLIGPMMNVIDAHVGVQCILSPEYDGKKVGDNFVYAFGKFPIMTFCHCVQKSIGKSCKNCKGLPAELRDEAGRTFIAKHYKVGHCYHQLLNCVPINVTQSTAIKNISHFYFDLIGFSKKDCYTVLREFAETGRISAKGTSGYFSKVLE